MRTNHIYGLTLRPCLTTNEDNERVMMSSDHSVREKFLDAYQDHLAGMQIVAECAKIYVLNNYQKIDDWRGLDVVIEDNSEMPTDYFNFVENDRGLKFVDSDVFDKIVEELHEQDRIRHNPIVTLTDVVLDTSDGDFSLTINGKKHMWICDDAVIIIANFIETKLNAQ
jgi:hypothetical protein